ncbi:MAG TPA: class I SAM-dependent methyltransferase [Thermoanaerobaculia bacterium]|jgi:SAM-dependent methyltransferase|nr:class I SAM-dependent methyltransferase [Thermoanaerobaculia bacterium]
MAWYREWFGDEYLELYANRDESEAEGHVDFVEKALGGGPGGLSGPRAVLDLACGAGRHTAALRRRGVRALGVDLSITLLIRGQVPCVAGDMRRLPFADGSFDWVLNFFTSFGYFESERENFLVLGEIGRLLASGGRFLIDLMNPHFALANLNPREVQNVEGRRVEIDRWYDAASQRLNKRIRVIPETGPARTYLESVRAYQPEEVTAGLRWVGLDLDDLYGSFRGEPYDRDSERLILVGHKPA